AGEVIDIETSAVPILWRNQTAVQIVFRDITKRKRAEEAMLKSQKLESLAVLAGGISHDFNNMLTAMLLQLTKVKKAIAGGRVDVFGDLDNCETIINRARDLTRQLLTFAEGGAPILRPCSLEQVVRQTVSFVMSGSGVRCEIDLPPDLHNVRGDENQISQVISNLLINATQAMPDGGVIKVVGRNVSLGPSNQYNLKPGDYVELVVADNGPGIPPEILPKIFDPYFTTKEQGTGLGLAIVYSVVKKHKGHISVDSKPGRGTVFRILLPATEEKVPQAVQKDFVPDRGEGKILVMDDEPDIRELIVELLREYGYEVDSAADGQKAVEKYARALEEGKPYDVVVLDLTVAGGLGGKETLEKLKQIDPNVKALLSSGYSNDPIIADYKKYGFVGVIEKPYRIEVLHKTIYSLIAEKKGKKFSPER
ncbi:response regulator, partial [bacterium]|nr:response regulator [bacterium]